MTKLNCWEFMKCGKGCGGDNADGSGVCRVADRTSADGLNEGKNGGRICWVISGDYGNDKAGDPEIQQISKCISCEFRRKVTMEEGLLSVCRSTGILLMNEKLYKGRI